MRYAPRSEIVTAYQYDGSYASIKNIFSLFPDSYSLSINGLKSNGIVEDWCFYDDKNKMFAFYYQKDAPITNPKIGDWVIKKNNLILRVSNKEFNEKYTKL